VRNKATIRDVARVSGTSTATVSRVLGTSNYPVSDAVRARVLEAVRSLNYVPNGIGKNLKTRSTRELGVLVPSLTNPYYAMLLQGVYDTALSADYHVSLISACRNAQAEKAAVRRLMEKRVDGLLLASIHPTAEAGRLALDAGFPLVAMDQALPLPCIQVGFPFSKAAALATEHLLACGHRRIGFMGAPLDRPSRRQMLAGFQSCLHGHGIPLPEAWVQLASAESEQAGNYEFANGAACALAFLAMEDRPTAYLCLNDMTAFGAMKAFREAGLHLPRDASIVGCDNLVFGAVSSPALTTLDQHAYEMGSLAAKLLVEQIEQPGGDQASVQLEPSLIVRDSVHRLSFTE